MASKLHDKYDAMRKALDEALKAAGDFKAEAGETFQWEMDNIISELRLARRYSGKPGEVLYCNWRFCVRAAEFENQGRGEVLDEEKAREARAIPCGEGEQWFKGRVHPECLQALQERRGA